MPACPKALPTLESGAVFSDCRTYRYALWRAWDFDKPLVTFIGLNPSTADENQDDPTIRRCISLARRWNFGRLAVVNLFAYRCTDPSKLELASQPIGAENDTWICQWIAPSALTVACWGNRGGYLGRDRVVQGFAPDLYCLRLTRRGYPSHPLYLPADIQPVPFQTRSSSS
jgi:hypothetical protein